MASLQDFLGQNVESYLFRDLGAMKALEACPGVSGGGAGYPLITATFAGIELLGALTSTSPFNARNGRRYFESYWATYLYSNLPESQRIGAGLYKLVRHGIAHAFVVKAGVGVVKADPALHLKRDAHDVIWIDASQLADDLIASYFIYVKPLSAAATGQINSTTMSSRLAEIETTYRDEAQKLSLELLFARVLATPQVPATFAPGLVVGPLDRGHVADTEGQTGPTFPRV